MPFTNVNDGVCDYERCCDGTEEWEGVGGVKCRNRCGELAKEAAKKAEEIQNLQKKGVEKRRQLVKESARMKREVEERIDVLRVGIEGEEIRAKELEKAVEEMAAKEHGQAVKGMGPGAVGVLAGLAQSRIKELRDGLLRLKDERDARAKRLTELELLLARFKTEYNPNFNDEGVKRTVRGWEEYVSKNPSHGIPAEPAAGASQDEQDLEAMLKEDSEDHGINFQSFLYPSDFNQTDDPTAALLNLRAYLPPSLLEYLTTQASALRQYLVDSGVLAPRPDSSDGNIHGSNAYESSRLRSTRATLEAARTSLEEMRGWRRDKEVDLARDYGDQDVFRALKGACVGSKSGEYEYEVCWMDACRQKGGHAGTTSLGTFAAFERLEEAQQEGGPLASAHEKLLYGEEAADDGLKLRMRYEGGAQCWNGPQRRTMVELFCGEVDQIRKVVEEEKCVYRMEVLTPAVCGEVGDGDKALDGRDEL